MFDELVKVKFSNRKCHEKVLKSVIDDNNKIKNETIDIFRFSTDFCVTVCKRLLLQNFAWFGCRVRCECLHNDDAGLIKMYFNGKYRIFYNHCLKKYVVKYKHIFPHLNF